MSKVKSVLHQLVREWSDEGATERKQFIDPMMEELERLMPVDPRNPNQHRVLNPGCGLGRLIFELVRRG